MNESVLIAGTEKFLGKIRQKKINIDEINDFESFIEVYQYLKGNIDKLHEFKDTMEIKGYKAPYRSLIKYGRVSEGEIKVEDIHDVTRHTQYFRMKAAAKKNILDRVKSSIASHKIGIGHLEELATVKCKSCGKRFKGHEINLTTFKTCICGSKGFELEKNIGGVYRLNIIKYLPLSGEYMVVMSELSPRGRDAFRKIVRILKHKKRGIVKTVSLVVKVLENGRWVRKRVHIDAKDQSNYEKEIREKYGSNARIEFMQFHRIKPAIINDKHVQTALSLAYVKFAEKFILKILDNILNKLLKNKQKMKIYKEALEAATGIANKMGSDMGDKREIREEWLNEMLTARHLIDDKGVMDEELKHDLEEREKLEKILFDVPRTLILWDIIKYYLITSYDRRSKYSGPFPKLRPNLDTNQTKVFEDFDEFVIKILKEYMHEKIEYISNIKEVVTKKFEIENQMKGLHVQLNHPAVGAAIMNMRGKLPLEESAVLFSVNPVELQKEKEKIEAFIKPTSKKAKKFLEMIKG